MKEVIRNTLAAMAGALTGMLLIIIAELIASRIFPAPAGAKFGDPAMTEFLANLPAAALAIVLAGYFAAVFCGGLVAGRLSLAQPRRQTIMVALLFAFASFLNLRAFPHPAWFWAANFAVVFLGAWLALRFIPCPPAPAA
jgi:hypothetical protein